MAKRTSKELTEEAVRAAVDAGAVTMTEVVRALGYKSVCGATTRKIRELVPDIGDRLKAAKAGSKKPTKRKAGGKKPRTPSPADPKPSRKAPDAEYPRPDHLPFRDGSSYAVCYSILAHAGDKGIERSKLVEEVARITGKEHRKAYFDVTVVCSSRPGPEHGGDGGSHRCIAKAADVYFVEKHNGHVTLRLRSRKY